MSEETVAPNGHEVVQTGSEGSGFLSQVGGILTTGISRWVDVELTEHSARTNADIYAYTDEPVPARQAYPADYEYGTRAQAADIFGGLAPWQLAGLALAGVFGVALLAGKFR